MTSKKRWHLWLILAVFALTIYNVLPTVFFYSRPLHSSIDRKKAESIAHDISERVNSLESNAQEWIRSFCRLLEIRPTKVEILSSSPEYTKISFLKEEEANIFRRFLPRAGSFIHFPPAQLSLSPSDSPGSRVVIVQRRIPLHFNTAQLDSLYQFTTIYDQEGEFTPTYLTIMKDRVTAIAKIVTGRGENAQLAHAILDAPQDPQIQEFAFILSQRMVEISSLFGPNSSIAKRFYSALAESTAADSIHFAAQLRKALQTIRDSISITKRNLQIKETIDPIESQQLAILDARDLSLLEFQELLKNHGDAFERSAPELPREQLPATLLFSDSNPIFERLVIDRDNQQILLKLHPDLLNFRAMLEQKKSSQYLKDQVDQVIYREAATVARLSSEQLIPLYGNFAIQLQEMQNAKSLLVMDLEPIASGQIAILKRELEEVWHPTHVHLTRQFLPFWDYNTYIEASAAEQGPGLLFFSPLAAQQPLPTGIKRNSLYVIVKGIGKQLITGGGATKEERAHFLKEWQSLKTFLQKHGFYGYFGRSPHLSTQFSDDFIFEREDYYHDILKATRENFSVKGSKQFAVLELSDLEQRIFTENNIDDAIHEELLKWRDDYYAASLNIKGLHPFDIPEPTQNVFWRNCVLSTKKFFRGDERKILRWGLDLAGGKTVQLELRDTSNQLITNPAYIAQGIEELHGRVNKLGLSEVNIRQEGQTITLDFPGGQAIAAADLVKASTMFFHVVNERFSSQNTLLASTVEQFLEEVWNEAVILGKKTEEDINAIAWKHLHGNSLDPETIHPRSFAARILHEQGLRLTAPHITPPSSYLDDSTSKIAIMRGDDYADWKGHSHPLLFVFNNFALEGANLEQVMAAYDSSKGNFIQFTIKSTPYKGSSRRVSPQDDFEAWTAKYCKEGIAQSALNTFSHGQGWRMAVLLNGEVISMPTLESSLRTAASITGSFTQREVTRLEADLKAGSLSFTPKILSEKSVSPELGNQERYYGILAMFLALGLVITTMVTYYRFSGIIASIALLLNLIIMWAGLQMVHATMTLASIAGVILTLGMAVDANVLVFERIKEELILHKNLSAAIRAGYRKAFSAILDSNITTFIAALVLLNFDSGPIKGFAVTLIIGLLSSMFTALFVTRYFFTAWAEAAPNKMLKMADLFRPRNWDFFKYTKSIALFSCAILLLGGAVALMNKKVFLGMDFTGGYVLSVEVEKTVAEDYRHRIEEACIAHGASPQELTVRELNPKNHLRIFLAASMEQPGHPFHGLPIAYEDQDPDYPFSLNPRIAWIVDALKRGGISITPHSLLTLDQTWSLTSGQMSKTMGNQAVVGLSLALLAIFIYITIRFEFIYAASATLCLLHDIFFTIGAMALLQRLGIPVQIDLHTVAALLTIVGYSLNDTIIVFDRIRENLHLPQKKGIRLVDLINNALNTTLSRTLMTSGTTLLALLPLIIFGGSTIFSFALVMGVGVFFGTLSSLFIAAPLMLYFHRKESNKHRAHGTTISF
jgi:SecD/SecF fusion protein